MPPFRSALKLLICLRVLWRASKGLDSGVNRTEEK